MSDNIIFDKQISGIRVVFQVEDKEYTPAEEAVLWGNLFRACSGAIPKKENGKGRKDV